MLSAKPDAIFITASEWVSLPDAVLMGFDIPRETTMKRAAPFLERAGWADLPAVRESEVHVIYHGGTRTLYDYIFLRYIAKVLHPQLFADVDPEAEMYEYYRTYLPVTPNGTFMMKLDANK
ncbi:hypothetical protein AAIH70_25015 [Neorhizobium sp. BT27B]|uniref:hypothetical protein n=1 Tax=Neorhizobium sp. BT27B TaxID=3142625 RepID=UPI003D2B038D